MCVCVSCVSVCECGECVCDYLVEYEEGADARRADAEAGFCFLSAAPELLLFGLGTFSERQITDQD